MHNYGKYNFCVFNSTNHVLYSTKKHIKESSNRKDHNAIYMAILFKGVSKLIFNTNYLNVLHHFKLMCLMLIQSQILIVFDPLHNVLKLR